MTKLAMKSPIYSQNVSKSLRPVRRFEPLKKPLRAYSRHLNRVAFLLGLTLVIGLSAQGVADETKPVLKIGDKIPSFSLNDFRGRSWKSAEFKSKAVVVVFFGVECPLVKQYSIRLGELKKKFGADFQIVGINSNRHDSIKEIENFAKQVNATNIPLLKDPANRVADSFGAQRTPEVFLFDSNQRLVYSGAIDDQYSYGQQKPKAEKKYLQDAVTAILADQTPKVERTQPDGCIIGRILTKNESGEVTYAKQISRILNDRCVNCHRPGEVAPFSLTDYDEVVGWAEMIQEVIGERRMPPWHANPKHGKFKNDVSLSKEQVESINTWVKNGAPFGDKKDLPEPPKFVEGWQIGEPDVVIAMTKRPYKVPATGVIEYKHFVVDTGFKEDKWIRSAELRIGNRAVVHHIIVALHDDGRAASHGQIRNEWLTATAPGAKPLELPEGYAKLIPAGSKLVFQMHYTPNGTPQTDISSVGFIFADPKTVRKSVGTVEVSNKRIRIPAGAENHPETATRMIRQDALLLALFPHMHLRGKSFRYIAKYPAKEGGKRTEEILLDVPNFDFNWQNGYEFETPKFIPKGTVIECIAHYDNSKNNFANPDPQKPVRWGDQTWEEMMIGYFDMALADQDLTKSESNPRTEGLLKRIESGKAIVNDTLRQSIKVSLKSSDNMDKFGSLFQASFPNVDRVCWTTFAGNTLRVERAVQIRAFREKCKGEGQSVRAAGTTLAEIQKSGKPVAIEDTREILTPDMRFMSAAARSSFHIPILIGGKPGTINFWSSELEAFPKPVQNLLVQLVNQALASKSN